MLHDNDQEKTFDDLNEEQIETNFLLQNFSFENSIGKFITYQDAATTTTSFDTTEKKSSFSLSTDNNNDINDTDNSMLNKNHSNFANTGNTDNLPSTSTSLLKRMDEKHVENIISCMAKVKQTKFILDAENDDYDQRIPNIKAKKFLVQEIIMLSKTKKSYTSGEFKMFIGKQCCVVALYFFLTFLFFLFFSFFLYVMQLRIVSNVMT